MSSVQVLPPFPTFKDVDGDPLHGGLIYIGVAGQNPISFPVNTFFDAALTIPAPQPLQTIDGYISNGGAPARVYVAQTAYSIIVRNKNSTTIAFELSRSNEFVDGPASSIDNELPLFNGTSGKLLKGSGTVVTAAGLALLDDANPAAQRATLGSTETGDALFVAATAAAGAATLGLGTGNSPTFLALSLTNGQITFPAVQVPSAGANTLDDYEEGTWTPVLTFATPGNLVVVYTTQTGEYTKVGRNVNLGGNIVTSTFTHTTASGNSQVTGIPFNPIGSTRAGGLIFQGITKATYTQFCARVSSGSTALTISASASAVASLSVTSADMLTGGTVIYQFSCNHDT